MPSSCTRCEQAGCRCLRYKSCWQKSSSLCTWDSITPPSACWSFLASVQLASSAMKCWFVGHIPTLLSCSFSCKGYYPFLHYTLAPAFLKHSQFEFEEVVVCKCRSCLYCGPFCQKLLVLFLGYVNTLVQGMHSPQKLSFPCDKHRTVRPQK